MLFRGFFCVAMDENHVQLHIFILSGHTSLIHVLPDRKASYTQQACQLQKVAASSLNATYQAYCTKKRRPCHAALDL